MSNNTRNASNDESDPVNVTTTTFSTIFIKNLTTKLAETTTELFNDTTTVRCNFGGCEQLDKLWNISGQLKDELERLNSDNNYTILCFSSLFILLMQCGFPLLQYGSFRSSSTINILIITVLNTLITAIVYWLLGYGIAFGPGNIFVGTDYYAGHNVDTSSLSHWFFHFTLAVTVVSIVSSAIGERGSFFSYVAITFFVAGIIHPVVVHWCWNVDGWLYKNQATIFYQDFAGAGVIHVCAGTCSMIAIATAGSRAMRFDLVQKKAGHVVPITVLGGFLLLTGFIAIAYGAQNGKVFSMAPFSLLSNAISCTLLAGAFGGLTALCCHEIQASHAYRKYGVRPAVLTSLTSFLAGTIAGMVSVSAGCDQYPLWAAVIVGMIGSCLSVGIHTAVEVLKGEDPLHTIGVHLGSGLWALIAAPIFKVPGGIIDYEVTIPRQVIAWNLAAGSSIIAWCGIWSLVIFGLLKCLKLYPIEYDLKGKDILRQGQTLTASTPNIDNYYNGNSRSNIIHAEYEIDLHEKSKPNSRHPGYYRPVNPVINAAFVPEVATQL